MQPNRSGVLIGGTASGFTTPAHLCVPSNKSFELTSLSALRAAKASPAARAAAQFQRCTS